MKQGTQEWLDARLGWTTGSRIVDIMPGVKGKYLASRKNYMAEKVIEILTDQSPEHFTSEAMQWGTDTEPLARSAYEAVTGNFVNEDGSTNLEEVKKAWTPKNLQWLTSQENLSKGGKY